MFIILPVNVLRNQVCFCQFLDSVSAIWRISARIMVPYHMSELESVSFLNKLLTFFVDTKKWVRCIIMCTWLPEERDAKLGG